jgi:signal transduction histidine kinase
MPDGRELNERAALAERLARFLETTSTLHAIATDRAGTIALANPAVASRLGVGASELVGQPIWRWLTDEDGSALRRRLEAGARGDDRPVLLDFVDAQQAPFSLACRIDCQPDGCLLLGEPVDADGRASHDELLRVSDELATLTRDNARQRRQLRRDAADLERRIGERTHELSGANSRLEHELDERRRVEADLRRSNIDLEQFAYVASHDLQEPLRMVVSYLQLIERRYKSQLDEAGQEFIAYAVDGGKRMQALINDLLAYSRVGRRAGDLTATDLGGVLARARRRLESQLRDAGAEITSDRLPTVLADAPQIEQLFQNLLANAVKFRRPEPPRVHVWAERDGGGWRIGVRDNGIGIAPEFGERIFELFQRLHGREEYEGTGIGLAIARKIVDRHGGRIWVESTPGEGATFYFTLSDGLAKRVGEGGQ